MPLQRDEVYDRLWDGFIQTWQDKLGMVWVGPLLLQLQLSLLLIQFKKHWSLFKP